MYTNDCGVTCGLLHDIGNPPFGHAGELAISTWFHKRFPGNGGFAKFAKSLTEPSSVLEPNQLARDFWQFEGNAQTLRLVSKLQVMDDLYGLNLTYGTLSASYVSIQPRRIRPIAPGKKPRNLDTLPQNPK